MINGRKIVTICGSTRFVDEYKEAMKQLTLDGKIVLSVGMFGRAPDDSGKGKVGKEYTQLDEETKKELDCLHKDKIRMSDEIYVLNKDGYIGESTKSEIEFAEHFGILVVYRFGGKKAPGIRMSDGST